MSLLLHFISIFFFNCIPGEMILLWSDLPEWNKKHLAESGATCKSLEFSALAGRLLLPSYFPPFRENIHLGQNHAAVEIGRYFVACFIVWKIQLLVSMEQWIVCSVQSCFQSLEQFWTFYYWSRLTHKNSVYSFSLSQFLLSCVWNWVCSAWEVYFFYLQSINCTL